MSSRFPRPVALAAAAALATAGVLVATPAQAATGTGSYGAGVLTVTFQQAATFSVSPTYDWETDALAGYDVRVSPSDFTSLPGCTLQGGYTWVCPKGLTKVVITGSTGGDSVSLEGAFAVEARLGSGDDYFDAWKTHRVAVYGEAGNDSLDSSDQIAGAGSLLDGGDGDDWVEGGPMNDTLVGGAGNDRMVGGTGSDTLDGGAGNDELIGDNRNLGYTAQDGNDVLAGGDGDDTMYGNGGADSFSGGSGVDTADFAMAYEYVTGATDWAASLDGVANDGIAGEGDNINADGSVENIAGPGLLSGIDSATVIGNDGPNALDVVADRVVVDGMGGDDVISAGSFSGPADLRGGTGNDKIGGFGVPSRIDGGAGDDLLTGSDSSNDTIIGGPGRDTIAGRKGADTIDSADGEQDTIACGDGPDSLRADTVDIYDASCEAVTLVTVPPPGTQPPGTQPPGTGSGDVTVTVGKRTKVSKKGVATFRIRNGLSNKITIKVVAQSKKPKLALGKATVKVKPGKAAKVRIKLTKKALRLLKRKGKVKAVLTFTATKGAKGKVKRKTTLVRR